jgi:glycogen(starch) synthase
MEGMGVEIHYVSWATPFYDHWWYEHSQPLELVRFRPWETSLTSCALANNSSLVRHVLRLHKQKPFDLIHVHEYEMTLAAFELRDILGIPIVSTHHLFQHQLLQFEEGFEGRITGKVGRNPDPEHVEYRLTSELMGVCGADKTIFVSKDMQRYAQQKLGADDSSVVIYNGVNTDRWANAIPVEIAKGKPVVLYCGRFAKMKGIEEIFAAIEADDSFAWVLVGKFHSCDEVREENHPYTKTVRELEAKYPSRVKWLGHVDEGRESVFKAADYVIIPSHIEPFCIVGIEALAAEKPVIVSSRVDGLSEYLDASNSVHCEPTPEGIIAGLKAARAADKPALIAAGATTAARFTWANAARQTIEIYSSVLTRKHEVHSTN